MPSSFPGTTPRRLLIVRQGRELGLKVPFIGGDGWVADHLLQIGGEALNGCYYSTHFFSRGQNTRRPGLREKIRG